MRRSLRALFLTLGAPCFVARTRLLPRAAAVWRPCGAPTDSALPQRSRFRRADSIATCAAAVWRPCGAPTDSAIPRRSGALGGFTAVAPTDECRQARSFSSLARQSRGRPAACAQRVDGSAPPAHRFQFPAHRFQIPAHRFQILADGFQLSAQHSPIADRSCPLAADTRTPPLR